jgi:hypothetical protein
MSTDAISPLRQRMIEDMSARKLNPHWSPMHVMADRLVQATNCSGRQHHGQ